MDRGQKIKDLIVKRKTSNIFNHIVSEIQLIEPMLNYTKFVLTV